MNTAYLYYRGRLSQVDCEHMDTLRSLGYENVSGALNDGYVRVRLYGRRLAIQGRSRRLCRRALSSVLESGVKIECCDVEYPGRYLSMSRQEAEVF